MNNLSSKPIPTDKVAKRKIKPGPEPRQVEQQPVQTFQQEEFGQSVLFEQSRSWSRGIVWTIIGITTGLVAWASFAQLEEAVHSDDGKLETIDKVKDVQVPLGGVVKQAFVKEGDIVTAGQKLLSLESTVPQAQLTSLQSNLASITAETRFYQSILSQGTAAITPQELSRLNVKPEILSLTKSRSSILAENQLYRAELHGTTPTNLTPEQAQRIQSSRAELASRLSSGKLEIDQTENQVRENRSKRFGLVNLLTNSQATIANIDAKVKAKQSQIAAQMAEVRTRQKNSQDLLTSNQGILNSIKPAVDAGALSRNQAIKQQEEVTTRRSEVAQLEEQYNKLSQDLQEVQATSRLEIQNQRQQIGQFQNEIAQLDQEYKRLGMATSQSREKLKNSAATSSKDLLARISDNDKRLAEIDGQLNRYVVENERKVSEITGQISQATQNLKYQDILSPVNGKVFELKAGSPGFVANTSEPVLKLVPNDRLKAKIFITNKDIGFIKPGMKANVRIDTFNFSEYGDVPGTVKSIGADSLPPDQTHPYERFPVTIELDKQAMVIKGRPVSLQPGWSVKANIKTRDRTVMSIFTDMVMKQGDGLKTIR